MPTQIDLDPVLPLVHKPGQYAGGELHAVSGDMDAEGLRFCLIFPDLYEIGMSHQGLQILYHILNSRERVLAHRAYAPEKDMEALLRARGLPLFSLEAKAPLAAYDVLGITLPYELCYTNILTILDLAGLPLRAAERDARHPLVLGGGSCAFNPEPVADFFDAIALGDGEELAVDIAELLLVGKEQGWDRTEQLSRLAEIPGIYVPSLFRPEYDEKGGLLRISPLKPGYAAVRKRTLPRLPDVSSPLRPLVPVVRPVHDRLAVEIARGCTRGCRFCQAGILYRPVRERPPEEVLDMAVSGIAHSGFEELALLSLSTGDYACLDLLMGALMDRFADTRVALSMPSMRVGTLTAGIMEQIKRVRKTGFTVAPEAGSERLRQVINKGITEEDLLATCADAFALGWKLIKFYFMLGLPTETEEDIAAIGELARKARRQHGAGKGRPVQINLGLSTFVPKPHTPFQWEEQIGLAESRRRIEAVKQLLPRQGFKVKWHEPEQSFLEGVFSRGDRRLSRCIEAAWRQGARLDGWSEHFDLGRWQRAASACGLDLEAYLRRRRLDETLPWDHLHSGVERRFLEEEYAAALKQQATADCRTQGCQGCGLCDFKTLRPLVHPSSPEGAPSPSPPSPAFTRNAGTTGRFRYRAHYSRLGVSRFYGHLEVLQTILRALQHAGLPLLFSQGFHPTPKVSFSQALPVGMESLAEFFDMELAAPLAQPGKAMERLNRCLPEGLVIQALEAAPSKPAPVSLATYEISIPGQPESVLRCRAEKFLGSESFVIGRVRKGRHQELDLRVLVGRVEVREEGLTLILRQEQGRAGTNPGEILRQVFCLSEEEVLLARIIKTGVREESAPS